MPFGGSKFAEYQECEVLSHLLLPSDSRLGLAFAPNFGGAARVRLTSHSVVSAVAHSDPKKPMTLIVPSSVTGWLRLPRQTDSFRIALKKGQQVVVSVESNSLNFPLDPAAQLTDSAGTVVAKATDVGPNREAAFAHAAAKDGDYLLTISDRFRKGGERFLYRLTVRLDDPDYELAAGVDTIVVKPGKPAELPIKVQRRGGSVGPITIQAIELPPGVTASPLVSEPTGTTAAAVTLRLATTGPAFSGPIRIVGKTGQPRVIERFVRTPPRLEAAFQFVWLTAVEKK